MNEMLNIKQSLEILKKLKERKEENKKRKEINKIVVLKRVQISTNNPAIAQLWIEFPSSIELPKNIKNYFEEKKKRFPSISNYTIRKTYHTLIIEIKSHMMMYSCMEHFIDSFKNTFENEYKIEEEGFWDKYEPLK